MNVTLHHLRVFRTALKASMLEKTSSRTSSATWPRILRERGRGFDKFVPECRGGNFKTVPSWDNLE